MPWSPPSRQWGERFAVFRARLAQVGGEELERKSYCLGLDSIAVSPVRIAARDLIPASCEGDCNAVKRALALEESL